MQSDVLLRKILSVAGCADRGYVLTAPSPGLGELPSRVDLLHASWTVLSPRSELDLRYLLWKANGGAVVAVLDDALASSLSLDLVRRAIGGRVIHLTPSDIVSAALRVPLQASDDDEALSLALEHLEALASSIGQRTLPTVVDQQLLDELLLDVCVGARIRRLESAGALVADWLRGPPRWDSRVTHLVQRSLPRFLNVEGRLLSWCLETGSKDGPGLERLQDLVVRGMLLAIPGDVPKAVWGPRLEAAKGDRTVGLTEATLREVVAAIAVDAVAALGGEAQPYLVEAENLGRELLPHSMLARSQHLRLGLEWRCEALVRRLAHGETVSQQDVEWLRSHRAAPRLSAEIALVEEMARLGRWLVSEPPAKAGADPIARAVEDYQRDGAFADLCAWHLRRTLGQTALWHKEARTLLDRWLARRDEDNERFARGLAEGYVARLHSDGVVPLHRLWTEVVLPAEKSWGRSLFVLVIDGCSYPVFLDLLDGLVRTRDEGSEPIGLRAPPARGADTAGRGIPSLAPLPSITSHARGAIFLGELPDDPWAAETLWRDEGERRTDPARFKANRALGQRTRRLFLKGDLEDGGAELRRALADASVEVVAAVFNQIDDLIGGHATGAASRLAPRDLAGFVPALHAAFDAGRNVLVVADHGHTPFLGKERGVGAGATARWCTLAEGESAPEGFLEVDVEGLGGPPGRKAFAWKVGAYRGKPHVGFHGGCGLEELVVPLAWLERGADATGADLPTWWYGGEARSEDLDIEPQGDLPKPKPTPRAKRPPAGQLDMYDVRRTQQAISANADRRLPLGAEVVAQLDEAEKALLLILFENGTATVGELAKVQGRSPARVNGFMIKLRRKLFGLGEPCFDSAPLDHGETQYRWTGARR